MSLSSTEYYGLLSLIYLSHHEFDSLAFASLDLDTTHSIEVLFFIVFRSFYLSLDDFIIRNKLISIEGGLDAFDLKWCEESIIDTILQRIGIDRITEISIRFEIVRFFRSGCESELSRRGEIFEDRSPLRLILRTTTMTLIDDDEVEEIPLIFTEVRSRISVCIHRTTHKCLENREKNTSIFRHISLLSDITRIDPHQRIFWKR